MFAGYKCTGGETAREEASICRVLLVRASYIQVSYVHTTQGQFIRQHREEKKAHASSKQQTTTVRGM